MDLDPAVWANLGPWGLVSVFVMMVLFGYLIPRSFHNQRVKDRDEEIKLLRAMIDKRDEQFNKLVEQNELTVRLLEDIKTLSKERRGAPQ